MKRNPQPTLTSVLHQEVRRVYCGSVYWARVDSRGNWTVTGDGTVIAGPYTERSKALEALDAVAPVN